jgi:uncharacterized protein
MSELRQRLATELQKIPLLDTHEHFTEESARLKSKSDFFSYLHYVECDLTSAGSEPWHKLLSENASFEEKRDEFFAYWPFVEHTGYGQALKIMAFDLFGVEAITPGTFDALCRNAESFPHVGYYDSLLKQRANIDKACRIVWSGGETLCDHELLFPVVQFDHFANILTRANIRRIEDETDMPVHTLGDLLDALEQAFDDREDEGMVGAKIFLAYKRPIRFDEVNTSDAERIFNRATQAHSDTPVGYVEAKPLQDFMVHRIIEQAIERDLPIQIHTGFQNDNGNFVEYTRPTHLTNLFMTYPRGKFELLHGGWPYTQEFTALAKVFPNVYADMAWTYIIGPNMAARLLGDLLDSVPYNKILGFGGDYNFAEGAYAHARIARRVIRHVLADRIEHNDLTEDEALAVARHIMHDSAATLYGFDTLDEMDDQIEAGDQNEVDA